MCERKKLEMPLEPIDQHRIEWWTVDTHRDCAEVVPHWAVYHVNTKWTDLYPERDGRPNGVDFVNHWQIFHNGCFRGRSGDGFRESWRDWLEGTSKDGAFFTREEAVKQALEINLCGLEIRERQVTAHREAIALQRIELGIEKVRT